MADGRTGFVRRSTDFVRNAHGTVPAQVRRAKAATAAAVSAIVERGCHLAREVCKTGT